MVVRVALVLALLAPLAGADPVCAYEGPYGSACVDGRSASAAVLVDGAGAGATIEDEEQGNTSVTAARAHAHVTGVANASASFLQRHWTDEASKNETLLTELVVDARITSRIAPQWVEAGLVEESDTRAEKQECRQDEAHVKLTGLVETARLSLPLGCPAIPVLRDLAPLP